MQLAANPEMDKSPVNLTELRKAGLTRACELTGTDPSTVVESAFAVWRKARHNVEPYLFPGVLETLTALKERGIRLMAITNGNADTDDIPCLKDLFEFCVMAEQVGEKATRYRSRGGVVVVLGCWGVGVEDSTDSTICASPCEIVFSLSDLDA